MTEHAPNTLTFGTWNVNARTGAILPLHLDLFTRTGVDLLALQEVTEPYYRAIAQELGDERVAYSLAIEPPEPGAPRNRRLGCAIASLNPNFAIGDAYLVRTTVCPERALVARVTHSGNELTVGSFHSPNGSTWGRNKALWFSDVTRWVNSQTGPVIFGIDANTPKNANLPDDDPRKWWAEDSHPSVGNAARSLVGDLPGHTLRGAWRAVHPEAETMPTSYNRDNRRIKRPELACTYDFVFTSAELPPLSCDYHYEEVTQASIPLSDHALVVATLNLAHVMGSRRSATRNGGPQHR